MFTRATVRSSLVLSVLYLSASLFGQGTASPLDEVRKELRSDGISLSMHQLEGHHALKQLMETLKGAGDKEYYKPYIDAIAKIIAQQNDVGLQDIDAYGYSVAKTNDAYDLDFFAHVKPGTGTSLLWKAIGGEAAPLDTIELLPDNTIAFVTVRIDFASIYSYVKNTLPSIEIDDIDDLLEQFRLIEENASKMGLPLPEALKSLSTEMTIFVTINKNVTMQIEGVQNLPQLAVGVIFKKKSDFIQKLMHEMVEKRSAQPDGNTILTIEQVGGYRTVLVKERLPIGTFGGYAFGQDYGIFSTDMNLIKTVIGISDANRLTKSKTFDAYKGIGRKGNMAFYASKEVSAVLTQVNAALPNENQLLIPLLSQTLFGDKTPEMFAVVSKKEMGLKIDSLSSFNVPGDIIGNSLLILLPGVVITEEVRKQTRMDSYYGRSPKDRAKARAEAREARAEAREARAEQDKVEAKVMAAEQRALANMAEEISRISKTDPERARAMAEAEFLKAQVMAAKAEVRAREKRAMEKAAAEAKAKAEKAAAEAKAKAEMEHAAAEAKAKAEKAAAEDRARMYKARAIRAEEIRRMKKTDPEKAAAEAKARAGSIKGQMAKGNNDGLTRDKLIGKSFHWFGQPSQWRNPKKSTVTFNADGSTVSPWNFRWEIKDGKLRITIPHNRRLNGEFHYLGEVGGRLTLVCPNWANEGNPHTLRMIPTSRK